MTDMTKSAVAETVNDVFEKYVHINDVQDVNGRYEAQATIQDFERPYRYRSYEICSADVECMKNDLCQMIIAAIESIEGK